jgi:hypothetical protein
MRPRSTVLACALAAAVGLGAPAARPQDDPFTLKSNPLRKGLDGWDRTGSDKVFVWSADEGSLTVKGASGKEPPRAVYTKVAWDRGGLRFQAKKGAKKIRVYLQPSAGKAVVLEFPRDAVKGATWTDLGVVLRAGKAVLLAPGADGKEAEVLSADLPAGSVFRFGFEAPSGTEAVLSGVHLERVYEDEPQIAEPGFESTFDGKSLGSWQPGRPEDQGIFSADRGLLVGEARTGDGMLALGSQEFAAYELRMRALWVTSALMVRAVQFPGQDGMVNKFDTIQPNLSDYLDPENLNDIVIRVAAGSCTVVVNGKKVLDEKVRPFETTPVLLLLRQGKRFYLRDIRIKNLSAEAGAAGAPPPPRPKTDPKADPKAAPAAGWTAKGDFTGDNGTWSASGSREIAGILCQAGDLASYELRFKVGKGAEGLSLVPRGNRGVDRSAGMRLADALFAKEEWTEVVLRTELMTARVSAGGAAAGTLQVDEAVGPPGIRVAPGGKATIKDLVVSLLKK